MFQQKTEFEHFKSEREEEIRSGYQSLNKAKEKLTNMQERLEKLRVEKQAKLRQLSAKEVQLEEATTACEDQGAVLRRARSKLDDFQEDVERVRTEKTGLEVQLTDFKLLIERKKTANA